MTTETGSQVVIDSVAERLRFVATHRKNLREKAQNDTPPRYLWERVSIEESTRGDKVVGGSPLAILQQDAHTLRVHCWGDTEADAERLRHSLIKALRQTLKGRNYRALTAEWMEPEWASMGFVLTQTVVVYLGLPDVALPTSGPSDPEEPKADPARTVVDAVTPTTTIEQTDVDGSGAVSGDDILSGGES